MVILLFEKLKGIIKDHQKKSKIKTPKIDPIFGIFLRLVNLPVSKLGNQNVIIDYQIVISKKGDFKTIFWCP